MTLPLLLSQAIPDHTGVVLMARIRGQGGLLITQASVTSVTLAVTDLTLEAQVVGSGLVSTTVLSISTVVFDQLQWDLTWQKDGPNNPAPPPPFGDGTFGYNFRTIVAATSFAATAHRYQCDVLFVPVTGQQFIVAWQIPTFKVYL